MMAPTHKIALIQLHPQPLQIESNYSRAAEFIRKASTQGAQLAVLPEYHLTGWVPHDALFVKQCAQWETYLEKYKILARECGICLVPGTIVQTQLDPSTGKQILVNVAYFISNHGEVLGWYQKKNLWHPERPHLTSSSHDPHTPISTPLGSVGLLICWDLAFPEAFRELIVHGAKIIIVPTFWMMTDCNDAGLARNPEAESLFLTSTLTTRAFENTCAVVFVNAGGPKEEGYAGLSRVAVPFSGPVKGSMEHGEEGMSIVELDMQILEEAEDNYKVRQDLRREDWYYGFAIRPH